MLLLVALVTLVVVRGQQGASDRLLRTTAATADDVGDPPGGAWIVLERSGTVTSSPGLPDDVGGELGALRTRPLAHPVLGTLRDGDGDRFRVVTARRPGRVVQVVQDLRAQQDQRDRLLTAMATAALLSLPVAAALGVLLGRRAVRPLAQALDLQRAFVADASHELRTPLTLLSTRVQVLDRGLQDRDVPQQLLADSRGVVTDVARLGEVVEDLLAAADPRADDLHDAVDVAVLVADVAASASAHAAGTGVTLTVDTGPGAVVQGSGAALRRAVLALVDNALEHTPRGGSVDLRVRRDRRCVQVSVSDTGPGIAPADVQRLTQRFHSGGQRAGRAHYGLGLALSHDVANRHGGQLRLVPSSTGTTFELVLPISG